VKPNPIVLVIDDDKANRRLLRILLESQSYRLFETENGQLGLDAVGARHPDVIILELVLPDMGGLTVLKRLRRSAQTPVLVLSDSNREADTVAALDGGANDYMTKPFSGAELLARLRVIRRCLPGNVEEPVLIEGGLKVDLTKHLVTLNGSKIDLTPTEEALLQALVANVGKIVSIKHLLCSVWGAEGKNQAQYLRVYISHLRKKLEVTRSGVVIKTKGILGYRLMLHSGGRFDTNVEFAREGMELPG
jgi:two-component system KDP operon response regulator KdpE